MLLLLVTLDFIYSIEPNISYLRSFIAQSSQLDPLPNSNIRLGNSRNLLNCTMTYQVSSLGVVELISSKADRGVLFSAFNLK